MVATTSVGHIETDPLRNFKFRVDFDIPGQQGLAQAFGSMGFMNVSGLNITTDVIPYREGGMNTTTQKMPGQTDFSPITMSKGLIIGNYSFMTWMNQLFRVQGGTADLPLGTDFRSTMTVRVLDHPRPNEQGNAPTRAMFKIYNAWPTSVSFSDLDAGANALVITQCTFAHEGFDFALSKSVRDGTDPKFF